MQEAANQQRAVSGSAPSGVQALGTRGTGTALPTSAWPPGPQLSRGTGPEPARSRVKEGSGEQLRAFRDAGLRPAARLPHTRFRRALTSCPPRAQRSGNSRIVVDVSCVDAPHKPGGLPQWTRCTELVPKLTGRVPLPVHQPAQHEDRNEVPQHHSRDPLSSRVSCCLAVLSSQCRCACGEFGTKRPQVQILSARHVPQVADLRECRSRRPMSRSPAHATFGAKDHSVARGRCPCDAPRRRRRTGSRRTCHRGRLQTPEAVTTTWQYYHFSPKVVIDCLYASSSDAPPSRPERRVARHHHGDPAVDDRRRLRRHDPT